MDIRPFSSKKAQLPAVSNIPFWPADYENCWYHYIHVWQIL